jgi:hypothetical protein
MLLGVRVDCARLVVDGMFELVYQSWRSEPQLQISLSEEQSYTVSLLDANTTKLDICQ